MTKYYYANLLLTCLILCAPACSEWDSPVSPDGTAGLPAGSTDETTQPEQGDLQALYPLCDSDATCNLEQGVCHDQDGHGYCTTLCETTSDCINNENEFCIGGHCIPSCTVAADCPAGYLCDTRTCIADPDYNLDDPGNGTDPVNEDPSVITYFGAACSFNEDCVNAAINSDVVCLTSISGGYCSVKCDSHEQCGETASCALETAPDQLYCGLVCSEDTDCARDELVCDPFFDDPICVESEAVSPSSGVGDSCITDSACQVGTLSDNICYTDSQGWPDGYCTALGCTTDSDCGENGICTTQDGSGTGTCFLTCEPTGTCSREGYYCTTESRSEPGLCLPVLPDSDEGIANIGDPCTIDIQCTLGTSQISEPANSFCIPPKWHDGTNGLPDGYCTAIDCREGGCGNRASCVPLNDMPGAETRMVCAESCPDPGSISSCREGYSCLEIGNPQGICWIDD